MLKLINDDILHADLTDVPINLVITSPPYNVGVEYDKHDDTMPYLEYLEWSRKWIKKLYNHMTEEGRFCINIPFSVTPIHLNKKKGADDINYPISADYTRIVQQEGFKYYRTIIWKKLGSNKTCWGSWRSARAPFVIDPNECILVFYKGNWRRKERGESTINGRDFMRFVKNLWEMNPETRSKHPAAFPPELPLRCIKLFSYKNDIICDPFMGSGTTGDVAVRLGRGFIGVEKSKTYFDMAKERIEGGKLQSKLSTLILPDKELDHKTDIDEVW